MNKNISNKMSLSGASSEPIISAEPKENQPRCSVYCQAIPKYDLLLASPKDSLHRHPERSEGSIKNNIKDWILRFANAPLRMTIPVLALLFSFNLSPSFAADCVPETTIINGVEKPLVECGPYNMLKYTYDSSGKQTNMTNYYSDGSDWKKGDDYIDTYDSNGNLESVVWYMCDSGNCEQAAEYKYKLDTAPDGTKIAKEISYWCSNGVCEKMTEYEMVHAYNDDTFTGDWNPYGEGEYSCGKNGYECDPEFPQSISATPFCPKGCNGCDVERACSACEAGYKKIETWCNKVRYTPAEAAAVLHDDNTNVVTITFRK